MAKVNPYQGPIAVTGATGLLGGYLVERLLEQSAREIVVLIRKESNVQKLYSFLRYRGVEQTKIDRIKVLKFNMSNPFEWTRNLEGIDTVFHCAAVVAIGGIESSQIIYENRELTSKLVDGCLSAGVRLLVHVSSIATLGGSRNRGRMVNENMRIDSFSGSSAYTVSKFFAENQVLRARAMGLNTIIVHPAVILGSTNAKTSGSASIPAQAIKKGLFYTSGVMGYVDVMDVARAMILLSEKPDAISNNYILCAGNLSYKALICAIRNGANKSKPLGEIGYKTLMAVSKIEGFISKVTGHRVVITKEIVRNMTSEYRYDGSKIMCEFNFVYTPIFQTLDRIGKEYISKK